MGAQAVRLSNVDIDNALKNKDLEVLFQPIFDLGNGALARMETFIRWRHPSLGVLPPGAFISFFETQGRMGELTRYVINEALDEYSRWRGPYAPGFSINLAQSDLSDEAFSSHFTKLLRDRDFPADLVTLECPMPPTETDLEISMRQFDRLRKTGARLAIEVRGRANDLLKSIDPFPFDEIKTGGSAILRFARTVRGPGMTAISDLLEIANSANAAITAVGVEDQASLSALRGLGFTAAQGNHLGVVGGLKDFRPVRVNEVRKLLDLDPLDSDSLAALFRTKAPAPAQKTAAVDADEPAEKAATNEKGDSPASESVAPDSSEDIVERLNKRVAQHEASRAASERAPKSASAAADAPADVDVEKRRRAREKAKALALAKRAKAREARKTAAIQRAKERAAQFTDDAEKTEEAPALEAATPEQTRDAVPVADPRGMQERLNKAFKKSTDPELATKSNAPPATDDVQSSASEATQTDPSSDDMDADDSLDIVIDTPTDAKAEEPESADVRATPASENSGDNDETVADDQQAIASRELESETATFSETSSAPMSPSAAPAPVTSLSLKNSGGSFQQVMRVANTVSSAALYRPAPMQPEQSAPPDNRENISKQVAATTPLRDEKTTPGPNAEPAPSDETTLGDLSQPEDDASKLATVGREEAGIGQSVKRRRRKNFLTRKYNLVPTHFWPRSWKRWYRRRIAEKA